MSIPRVKPGGWALNEKLTSLQITTVDQQLSQLALDKSVAGDTLAGLIIVSSGAGFDLQSGAIMIWRNGFSISVPSGATINFTTGITAAAIIAAANIAWTFGGTMAIGGAVTMAAGLTLNGGFNVALNSRSVTRAMTGYVQANKWDAVVPPGWGASSAAQAAPGTYLLQFELKVPHGALLTSVTVRLTGGGGHSTAPLTLPRLTVESYDGNGTLTSLGALTDTSASPGGSPTGYDVNHSITVSGLAVTIDRTTKRYVASLSPEAGTGAVIGAPVVYVCFATWTQTAYEED